MNTLPPTPLPPNKYTWYHAGIEQFVSLKPKLISVKYSSFFALLFMKSHYFTQAHCLCQADMPIITDSCIFCFSRQASLSSVPMIY